MFALRRSRKKHRAHRGRSGERFGAGAPARKEGRATENEGLLRQHVFGMLQNEKVFALLESEL